MAPAHLHGHFQSSLDAGSTAGWFDSGANVCPVLQINAGYLVAPDSSGTTTATGYAPRTARMPTLKTNSMPPQRPCLYSLAPPGCGGHYWFPAVISP